MDTEGARALARRIADGPPPSDAPAPAAQRRTEPRARQIHSVYIFRTEIDRALVGGRTVEIRRRVRKSLAGGAWVSTVLEERVDYLD